MRLLIVFVSQSFTEFLNEGHQIVDRLIVLRLKDRLIIEDHLKLFVLLVVQTSVKLQCIDKRLLVLQSLLLLTNRLKQNAVQQFEILSFLNLVFMLRFNHSR